MSAHHQDKLLCELNLKIPAFSEAYDFKSNCHYIIEDYVALSTEGQFK